MTPQPLKVVSRDFKSLTNLACGPDNFDLSDLPGVESWNGLPANLIKAWWAVYNVVEGGLPKYRTRANWRKS